MSNAQLERSNKYQKYRYNYWLLRLLHYICKFFFFFGQTFSYICKYIVNIFWIRLKLIGDNTALIVISHPLCFQVHQKIDKTDRKRLCRILDCKKLSVEASKNAAQNQLLPLRVIVQILFVEQARAAIATTANNITNNETAVLRRSFTTRREEDVERVEIKPNGGFQSTPSRFMALCSIPRQPKKMFCKLLSISRSLSQRIWKEKMVGDFLLYWFLVAQVKCFHCLFEACLILEIFICHTTTLYTE